jgi:hypothetical protein
MMGNTPRLVSEPSVSTEPSRVVSTVVAPATSLRAFDAVCSAP